MFSVKADVATQRVTLKVDQTVNEKDLKDILALIKTEVAKMKPGWVMASDFRGMKVVKPELNSYIVEIQKVVMAGKPGRLGTLLDSSVLKMQLHYSSAQAQSADITRRFDNEKDWLAYLNGKS